MIDTVHAMRLHANGPVYLYADEREGRRGVLVRFTTRRKLTPEQREENKCRVDALLAKLQQRQEDALTAKQYQQWKWKTNLNAQVCELIEAALDQPRPTDRLKAALNRVLRLTAHPDRPQVSRTR